MDSYSNRTSSIFTTFTTVLFTFATLNHLTYYFHPTSPTATVRVSREHNLVFSEFKNYNAEQVKFDLDISVDLRTEYSWNVNQFVVASYETAKNTRNEVVVFDKILREKKDYKFDLKQQKKAQRKRHTETGRWKHCPQLVSFGGMKNWHCI